MGNDRAERLDAAICSALAHRAVSGDEAARDELIAYLWPHWMAMLAASRSLGSFAKSEDHLRNIATQLLAKLKDKASRALELYVSWQHEHLAQDFSDWMRIVVANAARDYVRAQLGARPPANAQTKDEPSPKRLLNEFTLAPTREETGVRPPFTQEQTVRELLEFASARLQCAQCVALATWVQGGSFAEIEEALDLAAGHGRPVLRAAIAILRRHFTGAECRIDDAEA